MTGRRKVGERAALSRGEWSIWLGGSWDWMMPEKRGQVARYSRARGIMRCVGVEIELGGGDY